METGIWANFPRENEIWVTGTGNHKETNNTTGNGIEKLEIRVGPLDVFSLSTLVMWRCLAFHERPGIIIVVDYEPAHGLLTEQITPEKFTQFNLFLEKRFLKGRNGNKCPPAVKLSTIERTASYTLIPTDVKSLSDLLCCSMIGIIRMTSYRT